MRDEYQKSVADGRWRTIPTLPANLILCPSERAEIERHATELESLCKQTPIEADEFENAMLIVVTKLMLALPSAQQNDVGAEATGEAFQAALDDVPHWAVAAAVRRWYRGECGLNECGRPFDYHWRPAPAELRGIARAEEWRVKHRAMTLRKLLSAEVLIEISDDHCADMRARLAAVINKIPRAA
jgi:hypothetical protein